MDLKQQREEVNARIIDIRRLMKACTSEIKGYIQALDNLEASQISRIQLYKWYMMKEKSLYENLNRMKSDKKFFIGLFWAPSAHLPMIQKSIENLHESKQIKKPQMVQRQKHNLVPPTFIRVNEFTYGFQEITNTYGIPNYKEINPSYFGVVTFPFLFGVMFGDIGHGFLFLLFGAFLVLANDYLAKTALKTLLPYRYMLMMMGLFATFCGCIYNDMMSIPVELLPTCYEVDGREVMVESD